MKEARAAGHTIGVGITVLGKLFAGAAFSASRDHNLEVLRRSLKLFRLWPLTPQAAEIYGRLYATLHRKGRLIQQIDLQIAAIAGARSVHRRDAGP